MLFTEHFLCSFMIWHVNITIGILPLVVQRFVLFQGKETKMCSYWKKKSLDACYSSRQRKSQQREEGAIIYVIGVDKIIYICYGYLCYSYEGVNNKSVSVRADLNMALSRWRWWKDCAILAPCVSMVWIILQRPRTGVVRCT